MCLTFRDIWHRSFLGAANMLSQEYMYYMYVCIRSIFVNIALQRNSFLVVDRLVRGDQSLVGRVARTHVK